MLKKKAQVVMLSTEKATRIQKFGVSLRDKQNYLLPHVKESLGYYQELYIVVDERPKPDEWFITNGCILRKCNHIKVQGGIEMIVDTVGGEHHNSVCKKIIATTNADLKINCNNPSWCDTDSNPKCDCRLPQPSDSFIKRYIEAFNQGVPIVDVMIEYAVKWTNFQDDEYDTVLKVNPKDNTITITRCKESITKKELKSLIVKLKSLSKEEQLVVMDTVESFDNWIEQNL
jgi:hypothetical protein